MNRIGLKNQLYQQNKMWPSRFASCKVLILLLLQVISSHRTHQVPLGENYVNDLVQSPTSNANEASNSSHIQDAIQTPIIVLMSDDTISVAQLPMIEYGNISEIYRLVGDEREILSTDVETQDQPLSSQDGDDERQHDARSSEEGEEEESAVPKKKNQEHADAREYEQMPQQASTVNMTTSTASLGKSQWQQIAASERDREEVWPPQPTTQTNMNRKNSHEEDDDGNADKRQLGQPRRRRTSSSLSDERPLPGNDGGSAGPEASATSDAQTQRGVNRALESKEGQNVTSAQYGQQPLNLVLQEGSATSAEDAEEGDKTNSASASHNQPRRATPSRAPGEKRVRFSDFDVHMASGYAFAADSLGRIHRFKLPLSGSQLAAARFPAPLTNNHDERRTVSSSQNSNPSENDAANASFVGVKSELGSHRSAWSGVSDHQQSGARLNFSSTKAAVSTDNVDHTATVRNDAYGFTQGQQSVDSNELDKVGQHRNGNDVTHEQFAFGQGQHPAISGAPAPGREGLDESSSSVGSRTMEQLHSLIGGDNIKADSATPRVIWSRNKYARAPLTARLAGSVNAGASSAPVAAAAEHQESLRRQQLANEGGASTLNESNQTADEQTNLGDRAHLRSGAHVGNRREHSTDSQGDGARAQPTRGLQTEIAVDWLNNLLFVLDKCRLLVMDFDGNNELVLIDDFTTANRPVDIKLDPINDFLFWLQVGKFHNTIYKLDLSLLSLQSSTEKLVSNALYLRQSQRNTENGSSFDASDLVPLSSHHYAHPIITNLPGSARIFTLDHKHSKIYVPLVTSHGYSESAVDHASDEQIARNEAEVFGPTGNITHLNTTDIGLSLGNERDCQNVLSSGSQSTSADGNKILAYNLDGTDVGPFRAEESYLSKFDDMQDLTLDAKSNLLYWITNSGKDLVEEAKEGSGIQLSQHKLNNNSYTKLIYFDNNGFNQPRSSKSRFNVRKIIQILSSSIGSNRPIRSGAQDPFTDSVPSPQLHSGADPTRYSRNAPYIILGVTCLIVVAVYLAYSLLIQQAPSQAHVEDSHCRDGSVSAGSSSIGESRVVSNLNGFINSSTISRWIAGPTARSTDTSTFNRDESNGNGPYDIESTNYGASNAIDEHYRESILNATSHLIGISSRPLANLHEWPTNMHDRSNKLYVPVEVLQDDALSSIRRVSIDQLEIEKTAPLGEGHFGTVLQGKIKCTLHERTYLLDKPQINGTFNNAPISPDSLAPSSTARIFPTSSASSGHGSSSSTSCEFTTANTCSERTNDEDYLTPRNQLNSAASDYCGDIPHSSLRDASCIDFLQEGKSNQEDTTVSTKLRVAIKKLKENASAEEKRDFLQEAKLLANFNHPNIVHLIGICLDRGSTLIVMELMLGGDLIRYMQESMPSPMNTHAEHLTYEDLLKICLDIANGCCYLEDMDYIHRDLAARNCLVSSRKREERVVKLADFGLARDIYKDSYYKKLNDSAMPLKWMAPECLIEQRFTKKSDVWSFGVVMWEVMGYCQEKPYVGVEPFFIKEHLASGGRLRQPDYCDDKMYRLMNQCWQMEPENRPTFHECRAMLIEIRNDKRV